MKKKLLVPLCFFIIFDCGARSTAYDNIDILPLYMWGWFGNATQLSKVIDNYKPKIVVELGSWLGSSTAFIAEKIGCEGIIYAVDVWEETPECLSALPNVIGDSKFYFNTLYQQFLSNMIHLKHDFHVIPIKTATLSAASLLKINPNLIYVDASHAEEDVYNDIIAWYEKLAVGGIMCGDDWSWHTVRAGVIKAATKLKQAIYHEDNFWWFDSKK